MGAYQAANGTWVVRNGGYLGFGETRAAAYARAGAGQGRRVTDIFLQGDEWDALIEFIKGDHAA